ncbi:MAG: hypothetical protein A2W09_00730 [Deltaproteobacteria bacterium RBG_16_50_11]|nr:MAG: hypothetical protein A2W09_00730 [Deltaproteobacteria bacterium RBG_16_50_11]
MSGLLQACQLVRYVIASPKGAAIRRSRCEDIVRGNPKSSFAPLRTSQCYVGAAHCGRPIREPAEGLPYGKLGLIN